MNLNCVVIGVHLLTWALMVMKQCARVQVHMSDVADH